MKIDTHLHFGGQCQEAFEFYEALLGGSINLMLTYGDSPAGSQVPIDWKDKIVHANLKLNDIDIAGSDVLPGQYERPKGFNLILQMNDTSEAKRIFDAFSQAGTVEYPLDKTFWSPCYGVVVDQFGISWEINCAGA